MKHAIITTELFESDIRPPGTRRKFRDAVVEDAARFFSPQSLPRLNTCPACTASNLKHAFERHGFEYVECAACLSVFAAARPSAEMLSSYFQKSRAGALRSKYLNVVEEGRAGDVLRNRYDWVSTSLSGHPARLVDVAGIESSDSYVLSRVSRLESVGRTYCVNAAATVREQLAAAGVVHVDACPSVDVVVAFESLEHQSNPDGFLRELRQSLTPGGFLFLTTRSVSGFDLQVLWGDSPYVFFPEHLNLFSIEGLSQLFEREGYRITELSTPGHLDLELIRQAVQDDPSLSLPRFLRYLLTSRGDHAAHEFQAFLQRALMSSHVRLSAEAVS